MAALNNGAERIALEKPQATGDLEDPIRVVVVVDEVVLHLTPPLGRHPRWPGRQPPAD
jgi:hypothetical protein